MRYFVISDNTDTQVGLRLAGVEGVVARSKAEAEKAIDSVLADDTVGILLITEILAKLWAEQLADLKMSGRTPLVV